MYEALISPDPAALASLWAGLVIATVLYATMISRRERSRLTAAHDAGVQREEELRALVRVFLAEPRSRN